MLNEVLVPGIRIERGKLPASDGVPGATGRAPSASCCCSWSMRCCSNCWLARKSANSSACARGNPAASAARAAIPPSAPTFHLSVTAFPVIVFPDSQIGRMIQANSSSPWSFPTLPSAPARQAPEPAGALAGAIFYCQSNRHQPFRGIRQNLTLNSPWISSSTPGMLAIVLRCACMYSRPMSMNATGLQITLACAVDLLVDAGRGLHRADQLRGHVLMTNAEGDVRAPVRGPPVLVADGAEPFGDRLDDDAGRRRRGRRGRCRGRSRRRCRYRRRNRRNSFLDRRW